MSFVIKKSGVSHIYEPIEFNLLEKLSLPHRKYNVSIQEFDYNFIDETNILSITYDNPISTAIQQKYLKASVDWAEDKKSFFKLFEELQQKQSMFNQFSEIFLDISIKKLCAFHHECELYADKLNLKEIDELVPEASEEINTPEQIKAHNIKYFKEAYDKFKKNLLNRNNEDKEKLKNNPHINEQIFREGYIKYAAVTGHGFKYELSSLFNQIDKKLKVEFEIDTKKKDILNNISIKIPHIIKNVFITYGGLPDYTLRIQPFQPENIIDGSTDRIVHLNNYLNQEISQIKPSCPDVVYITCNLVRRQQIEDRWLPIVAQLRPNILFTPLPFSDIDRINNVRIEFLNRELTTLRIITASRVRYSFIFRFDPI